MTDPGHGGRGNRPDSPIVVRDVSVRYGSLTAIHDVDLELAPGTTTAVIGPNGSGKTTLLSVLAGLTRPSTGTVTRPDDVAVALVAQHAGHHRWMPITVDEVIAMGRYGHLGQWGRFGPADREAMNFAAERLEVADIGHRQFSELSGGQRQRVLVAQALATGAGLLLLDEPITGLDLASQKRIVDVVNEERTAGAVVVLTTHHLEEAHTADMVALLAGRLVAHGPPAEVLTAESLRRAYGARVIEVADDRDPVHHALLDDHGHGAHDGHVTGHDGHEHHHA